MQIATAAQPKAEMCALTDLSLAHLSLHRDHPPDSGGREATIVRRPKHRGQLFNRLPSV